ncbi:MAG: hypothetical protein QHG94_04805, partial [Candidatus Methanosuratincola sp.]|nr:hypothetical protein [Candidatus Methanosuratincola sp.]
MGDLKAIVDEYMGRAQGISDMCTRCLRTERWGGKVTLIEKEELGGTCLNWGCIPTKALLRGVELLAAVRAAGEFGIEATGVSVDFSKLMARKDRAVKTLVS